MVPTRLVRSACVVSLRNSERRVREIAQHRARGQQHLAEGSRSAPSSATRANTPSSSARPSARLQRLDALLERALHAEVALGQLIPELVDQEARRAREALEVLRGSCGASPARNATAPR